MNKTNGWIAVGLAAVFALAGALAFRALWSPGAILQASDGNVGAVAYNQRVAEASLTAPWLGETLWGMPNVTGLHAWAVAMRLLSARGFMNLYYGLCLGLAAWLLALHLRDRGLRPSACAFGGLAAFWTGTNLTLAYAGHIGKFGVLAFLALAVFALGRWGKTGKGAWAAVAGSAAGGMFLEQADVALFCALLLVPLGLYEARRAAGGWKIGAIAKQAWAGALAAALVAGGTMLATKGSGAAEVPGGESAEAKWAYLTQWSQPPGEALDFIAPGWTGWRSGEPEGPYWGKMGRSEAFMNFKLENVYVGAIPLLFALVGLGEALRRRREENSPVVLLWAGLGVLALLLAFGKYFPLYRPLSLLPGFSSVRNPNKFIHFFQMAWGVVAAFGLDAALRMEPAARRRWAYGACVAAGLFLLSGAALWADLEGGAARLAALGWGAQAGRAIQWNKAFAVTYAGGAFGVGAAALFLAASGRRDRWLWLAAWLPAAAVAFDASAILAPRYLQAMPPGYVAENDLVRYLKREVGHNRTAMMPQDGFYNLWLGYLFPYHGIVSVNVTQLPRPPADYQAFWEAVRDPVRTWRLAAVSHVLTHGAVAAQLLGNPDWARQLEVVWAYRPEDDGRGGVATREVPGGANAPEVVLRLKPVPPRVGAARSWRVAEDADALRALGDPSFAPNESVLLAPGSEVPPPPSGDPGPRPEVEIRRLEPGRYEFKVESHGPTVVRVAEKYDPNWKAWVNGKRRPILRADYMFQGIALEEARIHEVEMRYAPPATPVALQAAGMAAGLAAGLWLAATSLRRRKAAA